MTDIRKDGSLVHRLMKWYDCGYIMHAAAFVAIQFGICLSVGLYEAKVCQRRSLSSKKYPNRKISGMGARQTQDGSSHGSCLDYQEFWLFIWLFLTGMNSAWSSSITEVIGMNIARSKRRNRRLH